MILPRASTIYLIIAVIDTGTQDINPEGALEQLANVWDILPRKKKLFTFDFKQIKWENNDTLRVKFCKLGTGFRT